jgi:hypothetical protein
MNFVKDLKARNAFCGNQRRASNMPDWDKHLTRLDYGSPTNEYNPKDEDDFDGWYGPDDVQDQNRKRCFLDSDDSDGEEEKCFLDQRTPPPLFPVEERFHAPLTVTETPKMFEIVNCYWPFYAEDWRVPLNDKSVLLTPGGRMCGKDLYFMIVGEDASHYKALPFGTRGGQGGNRLAADVKALRFPVKKLSAKDYDSSFETSPFNINDDADWKQHPGAHLIMKIVCLPKTKAITVGKGNLVKRDIPRLKEELIKSTLASLFPNSPYSIRYNSDSGEFDFRDIASRRASRNQRTDVVRTNPMHIVSCADISTCRQTFLEILESGVDSAMFPAGFPTLASMGFRMAQRMMDLCISLPRALV